MSRKHTAKTRTKAEAQTQAPKAAPKKAEGGKATVPIKIATLSPLLVLISAPSGGGKTTLQQQLLASRPDMTRVITCTTPRPRPPPRPCGGAPPGGVCASTIDASTNVIPSAHLGVIPSAHFEVIPSEARNLRRTPFP